MWVEALKKINDNGILLVDCSQGKNFPRYNRAHLNLDSNMNPNKPKNYTPVNDSDIQKDILSVPISNKTLASYAGSDIYAFERISDPGSGFSWGAPYFAGLAALAYQVNPKITPDKIKELLNSTATQLDFGRLVNPKAFIDAVKSIRFKIVASPNRRV